MDKKHKSEAKKEGADAHSNGHDCAADAEKAQPKHAASHHGNGNNKPEPDYYGQLLSLKADFENYRKRIEKEKPEFVKFGKAEILLKLLPLYDLLMQAHQHVTKLHNGGSEESGQAQDIIKGLEMIFKEFTKVFDSEGIRPMDVIGKPYDPMAAEIIGIDEGDCKNDGLVTMEFQKGFYYGDKVLRPARVKIAKAKVQAPAEPQPAVPADAEKTDPEKN